MGCDHFIIAVSYLVCEHYQPLVLVENAVFIASLLLTPNKSCVGG